MRSYLDAKDVPRQTDDVDTVLAAFKATDTRMNILMPDARRVDPLSGTVSGKSLAALDA
jgi:hypothetical protein